MHETKKEKERPNMKGGMVIWTPGHVRVQVLEYVEIFNHTLHVLCNMKQACEIRSGPSNCSCEQYGRFD